MAATRHYKPRRRPREPFLLAKLARCGDCGTYMITTAGPVRRDGSRSRRYVCHAHRLGSCEALPVDARMVDHVFVAHLNRFLGGPEDVEPYRPSPGFPRELLRGEPDERWERIEPISTVAAELRSRIQRALANHDQTAADHLLDELVAHRVALYEHAHHRPQVRIERPELAEDPLTRLQDFYSWSAKDLAGELYDKPELTMPVSRCARRWFAQVLLRTTDHGIEITPEQAPHANAEGLRPTPGQRLTPAYAVPENWRIACHLSGHGHRGREPWLQSEIIHALRRWTSKHGQAPHVHDWARATPEHPNYKTVFARFGGWNTALETAGLTPTAKRQNTYRINGDTPHPPTPAGS